MSIPYILESVLSDGNHGDFVILYRTTTPYSRHSELDVCFM